MQIVLALLEGTFRFFYLSLTNQPTLFWKYCIFPVWLSFSLKLDPDKTDKYSFIPLSDYYDNQIQMHNFLFSLVENV